MESCKLIVITGGPGAGKTAILNILSRYFCSHVGVVPESASILFKGGFLRKKSDDIGKSIQRAIYYVQRELENTYINTKQYKILVCDRGTLDGLAYWPGKQEEFFSEVNTTLEKELNRYTMVIHLRTPSLKFGYNYANPLRIETAQEALEIDKKILTAWEKHPNRHIVNSYEHFLKKAAHVVNLIQKVRDGCCDQEFVLD